MMERVLIVTRRCRMLRRTCKGNLKPKGARTLHKTPAGVYVSACRNMTYRSWVDKSNISAITISTGDHYDEQVTY